MSDLITFSSTLLPHTTRVVGFRGTEAISRLYRFDVFVTAPSDDIDFELADAIGTKARLAIADAAGRPPFFCAGMVGDIALIQENGGRALLQVVIVPRLAELARSKHSRIFTDQSAIDVIKAVLEENGVSNYESHVLASQVEAHICQYRESDLDFISRWMEREGIRYHFEHGEDGEKLILTDDAVYPAEPLGLPVRYYPQLGDEWSAGPSTFRSFSSRHTGVPASIKLRDNDYTRPSLRISGEAQVSTNGSAEVSLYGERFFSTDDGQRLARIRAEEQITRQSTYHAMGTRRHLHAGYAFELEDHPRPAFNARYLVTEAHHHGSQVGSGLELFKKLVPLEHEEVYLVDLSAIPATTQFRPASVTAWPRIYGLEGAVIDGAATSDYAQIDAHGRYSVKLHFDESALKGGKASTLVRMMQPHGGDIEGFHFPLRKGTEVMISFVGGDPDRPVITGVVPNALNPSPVTGGNHTKNVIQTGGRNRLELEDLAGQQRITLSTPTKNTYLRMGAPNDAHELIAHTDGEGLLDVAGQFDLKVGASWNADIKQDWITHVDKGNHELHVDTGTSTYEVKGAFWSLQVPKGAIYMTAGDGEMNVDVKDDYTTTVTSGKYNVNVASDATFTVAGATTIETTGATNIHSGGDIELTVTGKGAGTTITLKAPNAVNIDAPNQVNKSRNEYHETYNWKTSQGWFKNDFCFLNTTVTATNWSAYATNTSLTGGKFDINVRNYSFNLLKRERTLFSSATFGSKTEKCILKADTVLFRKDTKVATQDSSAMTFKNGGIALRVFGFQKI